MKDGNGNIEIRKNLNIFMFGEEFFGMWKLSKNIKIEQPENVVR